MTLAQMPPIPEGNRFDDPQVFRLLGTGGGQPLYECWAEAVHAYAAQCAALAFAAGAEAMRRDAARACENTPSAVTLSGEFFSERFAAVVRGLPLPRE